jgi:hypothetical protein
MKKETSGKTITINAIRLTFFRILLAECLKN